MCCHRRGLGYRRTRHQFYPVSAILTLIAPKNEPQQQDTTAVPIWRSENLPLPQQTTGLTTAADGPKGHIYPSSAPESDPLAPPPAYDASASRERYADEKTPSLGADINHNDELEAQHDKQNRLYRPVTADAAQLANNDNNNSGCCCLAGGRWAARVQRKADKVQAKLERKMEKYARKAGRW